MMKPRQLLHCILTIVTFAAAGMSVRGEIVLANFSAGNPLKIMAVGDSITDDCVVNGAWRKPLQPLLETIHVCGTPDFPGRPGIYEIKA